MTSLEQTVVEKIRDFLAEFEQANITPNRLIINKQYLEVARSHFPYLFTKDYFVNKKNNIQIITTDDDYLGVGLVFDLPMCYNLKQH